MKNKLLRFGLMAASALTVALAFPMTAQAGETNYTYVYDYWEDVQECPDTYTVSRTLTYKDLGLEQNFKNPESLYVSGNKLYVVDTGNNRIVVLERKSADEFTVVDEFNSIKGSDINELNSPSDIAIGDDGSIYIADRGNARIVKTDSELNYLMEFTKPVDPAIQSDMIFTPDKIVCDTAGRIYCSATGINKGLVKYEADGTFSGFVGATPVAYNITDYLWKKFASQEQRAQMESFVPTEYDNVFMDKEGFIYACAGGQKEEDLDAETVQAIRKLNMLGSDILVRNGDYPVYGDLYWSGGGGITGPSYFKDVTVFDNDIFVCLDQNRGRLFGYDDQGRLIYAFGGNGNMDGYFRKPVSIEHMDYDLFVLDQLDCAITMFIPTEFGSLIYQAMDQFDHGLYDEAQESWEKVKALNGNYSQAYIGIGRSLLRKEEYKDAMEYFELKYDDENYSRAFAQYRKEWVKHNIGWIIAVILALFLIPLGIGKVKQIKHEIDTADIFRI
ncbi:MAG: hypothetical protein K5669_07065 [Lachnospiraceae bacterium]|nr:hypothetical protein [Lachnospiraceae bacterium]